MSLSLVKIPKNLSHIWIGPRPAPTRWMKTWRDHHPDWNYHLYDNEYLRNKKFKTQDQIEEYLKRGQYPGVADLMRLEILFENGGLMPGADSICLRSMEHLFNKECAYTVYENETIRGRLVSPIQAAEPGNPFIAKLIETLSNTSPESLEEPWVSTGNLFMAKMIEKFSPKIEIFPSHFTIPLHYSGVCYEGDGEIYAIQKFGSTSANLPKENYGNASFLSRVINLYNRRKQTSYNKKRLSAAKLKRIKDAEKKLNINLL